MEIKRGSNHNPDASRYCYDKGRCSPSMGWAQVDTGQDASYFGTWTNPETLEIFSYTEGDTTHEAAANPEEYCAALRHVKTWNEERGHGFGGIDPMGNARTLERIVSLGLVDLLHQFDLDRLENDTEPVAA